MGNIAIGKKTRIKRYIVFSVIVFTIAFIFYNSLQTAERSMNLSYQFEIFLNTILRGKNGLSRFGAFILNNIRKVAHFLEFELLGFEFGLFFITLGKRIRLQELWNAFSISAAAAVADETIQLVIMGRSAEVGDILLDTAGAVTGIILVLILSWIVHGVKKRKAG